MKRNPYYQLRYFANVPYLVTFGQGHADFLHDLQLNDTGVFLWEHLEEVASPEQLAELCLAHFQCSQEQQATMESIVEDFVGGLLSRGILLADAREPSCPYGKRILEIAGLSCCVHAPANLFSPEMLAFEVADSNVTNTPVQNIYTVTESPSFTENGQVLVRTAQLTILENENKYMLFFPSFSKVREAHIRKDGSTASIYCAADVSEVDTGEFSYAVRMLFFYFALQHRVVALHSASILYNNRLWLFSAPSGTGKSTHTNLWKELFQTPIINGDINLITLQHGQPTVCGNPWHGTSGIFDTRDYPLGGVILLKQGSQNIVTNLTKDQKELFLLHRCITPTWTSALLDKNHDIIKKICPHIHVTTLTCTQNTSAVHCCKEAIDQCSMQK